MIYILSNPYDVERLNAYVEKATSAKWTVEVKRKLPARSSSQNAYLHVLLGYFASEFGSTIEQVKVDVFKRLVNSDIFVRQRTNKRGMVVEYLRSTSALDTGEMTEAIERFRNWSAAEQGLYLPEPNEGLFLYAQQQIERNSEYL